jgi:hypothetical protein
MQFAALGLSALRWEPLCSVSGKQAVLEQQVMGLSHLRTRSESVTQSIVARIA